MQSRYGYTAPRNALSAATTLSQVEANLRGIPPTPPAPARPSFNRPDLVRPLIGGPYRRTDAESLHCYHWASAKYRAAAPRRNLAELLDYPGLGKYRPVYARSAREALAGQDEQAVERALGNVEQEVARLAASRRRIRQQLPHLADLLLP